MKNTLTIILAVLLSITFVFTAISAVISAAVVSLVDKDTIASYVEMIDYKEILESDDDISDALEKYKVKEDAVEEIIKSDAVAEVIDIYAKQFTDFIEGNEPEEFTADDLKDIVEDNMDELVEIANKHMTNKLDEAEIERRILKAIDENAEEIVEVMPSVDMIIEESDSTAIDIIKVVFNPAIPVILTTCSVILLVLVFVCRIRNAQGFIWTAIDCFLSFLFLGIFTGIVAVYLEPLILDSYVGISSVIGLAFDSAFTALGIGIGILAVLSILSFILYFIFRNKILPDNHSYIEVGIYNK